MFTINYMIQVYIIFFNIILSLFLPLNSSTKISFSIFQLAVQIVKLLVAKHLKN